MFKRMRVPGHTLVPGDVILSDPPRVVLDSERTASGVLYSCADARPAAFFANGLPVTIERVVCWHCGGSGVRCCEYGANVPPEHTMHPCASCKRPMPARRLLISSLRGLCSECTAAERTARPAQPMYETDAWSRGIRL